MARAPQSRQHPWLSELVAGPPSRHCPQEPVVALPALGAAHQPAVCCAHRRASQRRRTPRQRRGRAFASVALLPPGETASASPAEVPHVFRSLHPFRLEVRCQAHAGSMTYARGRRGCSYNSKTRARLLEGPHSNSTLHRRRGVSDANRTRPRTSAVPEPWRSANPSAHSPHTSRHARADRRQRAPAPRIRPVFGDHTGAQALRSVVVAVAVVVTVTRRVPPRRALHRSAFGSGHVEGGHLREAAAEAVSSVGWQCLQSGRAGELAMACLYLSRPRILLDLELQGLSLGKAAEAICVDVALVHEHLLEKTTTKLEATNRRGLCACPHAVAAVSSRQAMVPRVPRPFATRPTHIALLVVNGDEAKALLDVKPLARPSQEVVGARAEHGRRTHRREHGRLARPHRKRLRHRHFSRRPSRRCKKRNTIRLCKNQPPPVRWQFVTQALGHFSDSSCFDPCCSSRSAAAVSPTGRS